MHLARAYIVHVNTDFWKQNTQLTKYFVDEKKANDYMLQLSSVVYPVPTIVYIEWGFVVMDGENHFLLHHSPTTFEKDIAIEFAYYREATA